jgi:hypothetical protein
VTSAALWIALATALVSRDGCGGCADADHGFGRAVRRFRGDRADARAFGRPARRLHRVRRARRADEDDDNTRGPGQARQAGRRAPWNAQVDQADAGADARRGRGIRLGLGLGRREAGEAA